MDCPESTTKQKPTAAFVLCLVAGVWMLLSTGMAAFWSGWGAYNSGWGCGPGRWLLCRRGMMGSFLPAAWWPLFGVIAGVIVLLGAVSVYGKPEQRRGWAIAIIVVSAIGLVTGMGGLLPVVLGITGGTLALTWRSDKRIQSEGG